MIESWHQLVWFIHKHDYPKIVLVSEADFLLLLDKMNPASRQLQDDGAFVINSGFPLFFETRINVSEEDRHELKIQRDEAEKKRPELVRWDA